MNKSSLMKMPQQLWEALVNEAFKLRREEHILALAASPLAQSSLVEACLLSGAPVSADVRGRALQSVLRWAVDRLRPGGQHSWTALNWRSYNVLHAFYLQGMKVADVAERMAISNQTLYKIRPQAIAAAAEVLRTELETPQFAVERKHYTLADRYLQYPPDAQLLLRIASVFERPVSHRWLHHLMRTERDQETSTQLHIYNLSRDQVLINSPERRELVVHPEMRTYLAMQLKPCECSVLSILN